MAGLSVYPELLVFRSVHEAFDELGMARGDPSNSMLIWHDCLKEPTTFKSYHPWQIVNRIPGMNVLCRKASFARLIERIRPLFPSLFTFVPKTYILPYMNARFMHSLAKGKKRFIVKPDNGSLGQGIAVLEPGSDYAPDDTLTVAQHYIESFLIENRKFDLRIYAVVVSIDPLRICVYRDGVARFCSAQADDNSLYAKLTNVALNKDHSGIEISEISRLISDVIPVIENKSGLPAAEIWSRIDSVICLSVMSAYAYLKKAVDWNCPKVGYSRCFQILGFDILLDRGLNPHVLEVNYRPSLEYYRGRERRMKVGMIRDAILLSVPLRRAQAVVQANKWNWSEESWAACVANATFLAGIERDRAAALNRSKFVQIWPSGEARCRGFEQVLAAVAVMEIESLPGFIYSGHVSRGGEA
jgi:hypothetical protein